jgi:exopolysaccharide biosynthesis polyprenyl glycosylphosphotransferase
VFSGWTSPALAAGLAVVPWFSGGTYSSVALALAGLGVVALALLLRSAALTLRRSGALRERVLIVGGGPLIDKLIDELTHAATDRYVVVGVIDGQRAASPRAATGAGEDAVHHLDRIIARTQPARIVVSLGTRRGRLPEQPFLDCRLRGIAVEEAVSFYERVTGKLAIEALTPRALILGDGFRHSDFVPSDVSMSLSRAVSFVGAGVGLVLLAPVIAVIAVLIKLDSPGPVFFVQQRVGRGGRSFGLVKFRTMRQIDGRHSEWVRDNVDRITPVGKWLRRFRLDELPQFVNVLRGDMGLVGPRPHPATNYELFLSHIPFYRLRSAVRPGITGWAQIRYGYANTLEEETEKMRYDLYYIKHRSLGLDVRILLRTVGVLLFDRRSHEVVRTPAPALPRGATPARQPAVSAVAVEPRPNAASELRERREARARTA